MLVFAKKISLEIELKIKEAYEKKKVVNNAAFGVEKDDDEVEALEETNNIRAGKRPAAAGSTLAFAVKGDAGNDHMDLHTLKSPEASNKLKCNG